MKVELKTEKGNILFLKVPNDAIGYSLNMFDNIPHLQLRFDKHPYGDSIKINRKRLEFNPWQLIGLTTEITEERCLNMGYNISALVQLQKISKGKWVVLFKEDELFQEQYKNV